MDLHNAKANAYFNEKDTSSIKVETIFLLKTCLEFIFHQKMVIRRKKKPQEMMVPSTDLILRVLFLTFKDIVGDKSLCMLECRELINAVYLGFGWH